MNQIYCLGAPDPEMREIEAVLNEHGLQHVFATLRGRRVISANAYDADGVSAPIPVGAEIVFVECSVLGLEPSFYIDHHREGDPGFDVVPERYMEGSSLGQLLSLLKVEATSRHRLLCAADHCPVYAYQGRCPGVDPLELAAFRIASKAELQKVSLTEAQQSFANAQASLVAAERVNLWGTEVAWVSDFENEFIAEASAFMNIPLMYTRLERDQRRKVGILNGSPDLIRLWMDNCGLNRVYGSPERGYAGGYQYPVVIHPLI